MIEFDPLSHKTTPIRRMVLNESLLWWPSFSFTIFYSICKIESIKSFRALFLVEFIIVGRGSFKFKRATTF